MNTEKTQTMTELSPLFVLRVFWFGLLVVLPICCVCLAIGITYWTLMALRAIASVIRSSWRRLLNSGYGWSKRQKTHWPRSDYGWRPEL